MSKDVVKVVLLGGNSVGKSCFLRRYTDKKFYDNLRATIGADFMVKTEHVGKKSVKFQIWDTSGQERFIDSTKTYLIGADVCVLMYSTVDLDSHDILVHWTVHIKKAIPTAKFYVIGTKLDIAKEDPDRRMLDLCAMSLIAEDLDCDTMYETSARTGENIDEFFKKVAEDYLTKKKAGQTKTCEII